MQSLEVSLSRVNLFFNFLQFSGVSSKHVLNKEKESLLVSEDPVEKNTVTKIWVQKNN